MIGVTDIVRLPYAPDLTEGGIAYALRTLPHTFDRAGSSPHDRLRRVVAGAAVELAFRRYLGELNIPFDVKSAAPFTDPDRYDVTLGGRRCELKSFLISRREQVAEIRRDPAVLLNAPALVPSDHHAGRDHSDYDMYLFAFLSAYVTASQADMMKVVEAGEPHTFVHVMAADWRRPVSWNPLGPLALKSESKQEIAVEVHGQTGSREFTTCTVNLPPQMPVVLENPFYSLSCLRVPRLPRARLGIRCEARRETCLIPPLEWGNIQVYGMDIYFVGYIPRGEFRRRAKVIVPNSHVFQYDRTHVKNLAVPVANLQPLGELFEKARRWESASA